LYTSSTQAAGHISKLIISSRSALYSLEDENQKRLLEEAANAASEAVTKLIGVLKYAAEESVMSTTRKPTLYNRQR
jgi:dihydrodipicolinate synthase/N-acetylneuraminate lyase